MRSYSDELEAVTKRVEDAKGYLKLDSAIARTAEIEPQISAPDLWDDLAMARKLTGEYNALREDIAQVDRLWDMVLEVRAIEELLGDEDDQNLAQERRSTLDSLISLLSELELRALFSGEDDESDAILEIKPRAGGTDAQDWAEMLLRMYQRWADQSGFEVEVEDISPGQEAGIQSATLLVKGRYAHGMLQSERGVHRLVRMSPFNSKHSRETSFALVQVFPLTDAAIDVKIDDKDLRIDTFRSSGAGGQHVNVTDSAVRITHLPTNIVVSCQNERSQLQNKAKALQVLAAKLIDREKEEQRVAREVLAGSTSEMGWGNQIRSYFMAPYQLVKDLRTLTETGNVDSVMNGEISFFMESYLRWSKARS
ncbi:MULTISPECIES: peptide chain release factor 2 [Acidithrix]|uniref:Peptide chain release factor 2 n=2 Tax=root TaxID=1 RepID=A0A0D8HF63_9ACTN|nr:MULTISPECIES: peptide chain release factor 2 [Acidithrix]KJF15701.1 peptide chain release factor 2 [Acidithrix ferrooxidans]CAG4928001.1 unnamed protein product [Acidithrix sp. C25]